MSLSDAGAGGSDAGVGGSGSVQSGQTQNASGLAGLFGGSNVSDPNAAAYNGLLDSANTQSQTDQGLGYGGFTQQAAQISNPYQAQSQGQLQGVQTNLGNVGGLEMQTAEGQGPAAQAAQAQIQSGTNQAIASQVALARSATGGAQAQNAAMMNGQNNAAQLQGTSAAQSQQTLANMAATAAGQASQTYGTQGQIGMNQYQLEQQNAQQQAALAQQNQGQQNQMQLGLLNNATASQGQGLAALNGYGSQQLAAEGLAQQEGQQELSDVGGIAQAGGSTALTLAKMV